MVTNLKTVRSWKQFNTMADNTGHALMPYMSQGIRGKLVGQQYN